MAVTVYVLGEPAPHPGPVKIGFTAQTADCRLRDIKSGPLPTGVTGRRLRVLYESDGDGKIESKVHRRFKRFRLTGPGREWFNLDPATAPQQVATALAELGVRPAPAGGHSSGWFCRCNRCAMARIAVLGW
jgi:hypothetical protein